MAPFKLYRPLRAGELSVIDGTWRLAIRSAGLLDAQDLFSLFPTDDLFARGPLKEFILDLSELAPVYPSFVALLAAWHATHVGRFAHAPFRLVPPTDHGADLWLSQCGLYRIVGREEHSNPLGVKTLALREIMPTSVGAADIVAIDVAERLEQLIATNKIPAPAETISSLCTAVSELVDNVLKHASITSTAFAGAQVHPRTHKLSICIADSGMGIERSFTEAPVSTARDRMASGEHYLALAIEPHISSKFGMNHSGYGLFFTSELCALSQGTFVLTSGEHSLVTYAGATRFERHAPWPGTVVNILLDTMRPITSSAVWRKLPGFDDSEWVTRFVDASTPPEAVLLVEYGRRLYTRDLGDRVLKHTLSRAESRQGELAISMAGVDSISPSFADQVFGNLAQHLGAIAYAARVRVYGTTEYTRKVIEMTVGTRLRLLG